MSFKNLDLTTAALVVPGITLYIKNLIEDELNLLVNFNIHHKLHTKYYTLYCISCILYIIYYISYVIYHILYIIYYRLYVIY